MIVLDLNRTRTRLDTIANIGRICLYNRKSLEFTYFRNIKREQ